MSQTVKQAIEKRASDPLSIAHVLPNYSNSLDEAVNRILSYGRTLHSVLECNADGSALRARICSKVHYYKRLGTWWVSLKCGMYGPYYRLGTHTTCDSSPDAWTID